MESTQYSTSNRNMEGQTKQKTVLLLLSGGKDSRQALRKLVSAGWQVQALCIDGKQGLEKQGAAVAAADHGVHLDVVSIASFDEATWNPIKLISRDLLMAYWAVRKAKQYGAQAVATGVKRSDIENPKLWWLSGFLKAVEIIARLLGVELIHPIWEED